jgi:Fe-S cluster assembly protein SufD
MTAEPRAIRTAAETAIAGHFAAALPGLPGGRRTKAAREAAFDVYQRLGLPHRRVEEWKYTDLRALMRTAEPPAPGPSEDTARRALAAAPDAYAGLDRYRLVFVDGRLAAALSDLAALAAAGVEVASLAAGLAADAPSAVAMLAAPRLAAGDVMVALNAAFAADGAIVRLRAGALLARPIELVHVATAGSVAARHRIEVGDGATLRLMETHHGIAGAACQVNVVTTVAVGANATVGYARLQSEGAGTIHVGTGVFDLGAGAALDHLTVTAGAAVSRSQVFLTTGGERTRAGLWGATMIGGRQHADATLVIDHALPGAATRVLYKSVVDGESEGVFQGKVIVERDAQKTDAKMTSRSLLLSERAEFAAKPELEIYADDVQCGHGATSGQIDPSELFYLMARGIPRHEAERLLVEAFLGEAVEAPGDGAVAAPLRAFVGRWLARRGAA